MQRAARSLHFPALPTVYSAVDGGKLMVAPILIFAIGNESRGDDAIAPCCCAGLPRGLRQRILPGGLNFSKTSSCKSNMPPTWSGASWSCSLMQAWILLPPTTFTAQEATTAARYSATPSRPKPCCPLTSRFTNKPRPRPLSCAYAANASNSASFHRRKPDNAWNWPWDFCKN